MDATPALESIARLLPGLPEQSIEDQLVVFDALVRVCDEAHRPAAAQMLRDAAETSQDPARRERLLQAAGAVSGGQPCAFTPDGLSAGQAAAAQSVTLEEWNERAGLRAEEEEESEEPDYMDEAPPKLPPLPVRHFFSGLVVRVGRNFADAQGRAVCEGEVLKVLLCERTDEGGYLVNLYAGRVRLDAGEHGAMIDNARNTFFQPVPTNDCLEDLWEAIDRELNQADRDEDEETDDDDLAALREEVEACSDWLSSAGDRGPAPECDSWRLAAEAFGRDHSLTVWTRLLFAGIRVAMPA